jgi:uncharacterized membrane protein YbaN (DUF454 family)
MRKSKRFILVALGLLFVGLGIVGILIPGFPTTPFLILAAACFFRSSKKLYNWLISTPRYGKTIKKFQEEGTVSKKAKIISLTSMWGMITLSAIFLINTWWIKLLAVGLGLIGSLLIFLIPTS